MGTNGGSGHHYSPWPQWEENKPFALVLLLVGAFLVVFLMVKTDQAQKETEQIGKPTPFEHQITVEGEGRAIGKPDIATVTLGVDTKAEEVASAQATNSTTVNALIEKVKMLGISADDIQTSAYNVYENTQWNPDTETYESVGWVVSQTITVKVRDTSKISMLLDVAGKSGVTNISGPSFTVDDQSALKDEARVEAIADAKEKAAALAGELGVRFERVVGYSEWVDSGPIPYYAESIGYGGGGAPAIEPGTDELKLHVSITYKLVE